MKLRSSFLYYIQFTEVNNMINISKISFPLSQLLGETDLILLGATATYEYVDGKKTDNIVGTTYEIVQNGGTYEKFKVKVSDADLPVESDFIKNATNPIFVEFTNPICKLYTDNRGQIQVSVKADAITVL